jgi:hypothetical protein
MLLITYREINGNKLNYRLPILLLITYTEINGNKFN